MEESKSNMKQSLDVMTKMIIKNSCDKSVEEPSDSASELGGQGSAEGAKEAWSNALSPWQFLTQVSRAHSDDFVLSSCT